MKYKTIYIMLVVGLMLLSCKKEVSDFNYVRYVVSFEGDCEITWKDLKGTHTIVQCNGLWATEYKTPQFLPPIYIKAKGNNLEITVYCNGSLMRYKKGNNELIINN